MTAITENLPTGHICYSERLAVRVAAGAWCLGCFFLVQIYCCTLTSHLTSPNQRPIVNSFYEIANTPGVRITVDKGFAMDNVLKQVEYLILLNIMGVTSINNNKRLYSRLI